ncbi:MAG: CrcB family protein [Ilumatobacteraceae bacterium]
MRSTLLVALGGAVGAGARWSISETFGSNAGRFPWSTFVVNVVGCALIGLATRRLDRGSDAWYGVVTGVLGGFTTFSAFAVETRALLVGGHISIAVVYVVASCAVGIGAVELGRRPAPAP